ncbi:hypothetical protein TrST_g12287 [Triparma strigata]|uniref:Uncharacterized protein n=1 Tax=Triparma strigata TaxID=1606541 RepID=A0A9W7BAH7_9STRA|nr:hypothetical protein TrST_g12287 [Triparma strigata]
MCQAKIHPDTADTKSTPLPRHQSSFSKIAPYLKLSLLALYMGAGLSIMDLIFDIAMVTKFTATGHPKFATATLASICLSIFFQLYTVTFQNYKRGKRIMLREVLFVVTFVKPGVDVYRVVTKQKQAKNTMLDPLTEMLMFKSTELCFECIPGAIIQTMGFVNGGHSLLAIMSLISSILTAAFISTSITIEKDVDKESRNYAPNFWGLVNLGSRRQAAAVCVLVLLISACQLASKSFAISLCGVESGTILTAYLGIDMGLALAYKTARGDFRYWLPLENQAVSGLFSLLSRLSTKFSLDFTGLMMLRHPFEYGGIYFTLVLLTTPLVSLYFGSRYLTFVEDEEVKTTLDYVFSSDQIYGGLGCLAAVQFLSFSLLMSIVPSKIRKTFFSTQTGQQFTCTNFEMAQNDLAKLDTFSIHPSYYVPIKEGIKAWLNERLPVWIAEEPDWFDDQKKATIPDEYVIDPSLLKRIRGIVVEKIRERRRSTFQIT